MTLLNKCAQSFRRLPYIPALFLRCAMSNFLLRTWFLSLVVLVLIFTLKVKGGLRVKKTFIV